MATHLSIEVIQRPCVFVLHITDTAETLKKLALFFPDRKICIDNLQLHRYPGGEGQVIIHCQIEKDRINRTVQLLEMLPGVMKLEKMEGR